MGNPGQESSSLFAAVRVYDKDALRSGAHLMGDKTARELLGIVERAILERPLPAVQDVIYGLQLAEEFARIPGFQGQIKDVAQRYNALVGTESIVEIPLFRACLVPG